jgi:outer membrane biogenesis lipoprotein LolB
MPLALAAALVLSATACTQDPSVSIAEAETARRQADVALASERTWSHVGPFGIPSLGWTWIVIVACVALAAVLITGMSLLYWNRQNKRDAEKLYRSHRKELALALANRPECIACGTNPATHASVQATIRLAEDRADALAVDAT